MKTFITDIKKILIQLLKLGEDDGQYSEATLDSGIKTSRMIKCFKQNKDVSYYASMFNSFKLDKREFVRIVIEIPIKQNLKSKNIELVLQYMKLLESYFVYTDYIKLYIGEGLIHIDTYRENKFPADLFTSKSEKPEKEEKVDKKEKENE